MTIDQLTKYMARLPGLGPRSARRLIFYLLKNRESLMVPLGEALKAGAELIKRCKVCGNFDEEEVCHICRDLERESRILCVVEEVDDLWAIERSRAFKGKYHVLGGVLSALDGVNPNDLNLSSLPSRIEKDGISEVVVALSATIEGQTTSHYIHELLASQSIKLTRLGHGLPFGGELEYLDEGTIIAALQARRLLM